MGLVREELTLASATLSGGARLASAGSGLPERLTTAATSTIALGGASGYCGVCWDPDGLHIWHARSADSNQLRKWRVSDGTEITAARVVPGGTIMSVTRDEQDKLIVAGYGSKKFYVIDPTTLAVTTVTPSGAPTPYAVIRIDGKFWSINSYTGGNAVEYGEDGTATGRSVSGTWTGIYSHPEISGYFWLFRAAGAISRIRTSDLAATTFTVGASYYGAPGEAGQNISGCVDSTGKLYGWTATRFRVDRWPAAGGAAEAVALWPDQAYGVTATAYSSGSMQHSPFLSFTDTDAWVAWMCGTTGATTQFNAIRARCVGTQRCRWTRAFPGAVTLTEIVVPGLLGRTKDASNDYRATRCYYSLNGGLTRTEFSPDDQLSVAIPAGSTLTVDVDFCLRDLPPMADPYVGDSSGNGLMLSWEDPTSTSYPVSGVPASATTLTAIRTNYTTALEALTPTAPATVTFHNSTLAEWFEAGRADDLRLFHWDSGRPFGGYESEDLGVADYSCRFVREHLTLRVRYPRLPNLYPAISGGNADDAMEALIRADADQICDALRTAVNYVAAMTRCEPEFQIDHGAESAKAWTLVIDCAVDYYRAQTVL